MNNLLLNIIDDGINGCLSIDEVLAKMKNNNIENNIIESTHRLLKAWKLFNENDLYKFDFEICLRDFLLLTNLNLKINSYELSDNGCNIGLHKKNDQFWCDRIFPSYVNKKFVNKVFEQSECNNLSKNEYFLNTPSFIRKITNNKFIKFRSEEQKLSVLGALKAPPGYSVLISMPTGGGKSLIIQSLAFQEKKGLSIVVVPTISLMLDQYKNAIDILGLGEKEIAFYNSDSNLKEIVENIKLCKLRLLFLSPESLIKNKMLKDCIFEAAQNKYVNNLIVDEAHIILEWGDSFRLDFQCLDVFYKKLSLLNENIRVFLLSATFTQKDVKTLKYLYSNDNKWIELRFDSLRKEIHYNFVKTSSFVDKQKKLIELVKTMPHPMIIYVNRPEEAKNIEDILKKQGILNINTFTGETVTKERNKLIDAWKNNDFQIMIATCAFGVGVDKKDVRTVLHYYIPDNASKYYQEAGRGGRDGKACLSIILYNDNDFDSSFSFIKKKVLTTEKIIERWFSMYFSSKTVRFEDGTCRLDMSIVPRYSSDEYFITVSNSKHIAWNVYVILFLKRHKMVDIVDVEFENENYYLTVKILNIELLKKSSNIFEIVNLYRENDWSYSEKCFLDIKNAIINSFDECISELFLKTYPLVQNEFCSGCNNHDNVKKYISNTLPLSSNNKYINISSYNINFEKNVLIVNGNDINLMENYFSQFDNVSFIQLKERIIDSKYITGIYCYDEFYKLLGDNNYYFSKLLVFECPYLDDEILKLISSVSSLIDLGIKIVILTTENKYIERKNKYLYELVESSYKEFYMIEKELE